MADPTILITAIGVPSAAAVGALGTYLVRRRQSSGQVGTSDAATLWAQSQEMRNQLLAEKQRAEDQRDRILQIQTDTVGPALEATSVSLKQILAALVILDDILASQSRMDKVIAALGKRYIIGQEARRDERR